MTYCTSRRKCKLFQKLHVSYFKTISTHFPSIYTNRLPLWNNWHVTNFSLQLKITGGLECPSCRPLNADPFQSTTFYFEYELIGCSTSYLCKHRNIMISPSAKASLSHIYKRTIIFIWYQILTRTDNEDNRSHFKHSPWNVHPIIQNQIALKITNIDPIFWHCSPTLTFSR